MDQGIIEQLKVRVREHRQAIRGEEAIKASLVMPFMRALGYDVFDPFETVAGYRNGDGRADFALLRDGSPSILISVTSTPDDMETARAKGLAGCLPASGARCAVMTDGALYRFMLDSAEPGVLDPSATMTVDLASDLVPDSLALYSRDGFDIDAILADASERRYPIALHKAFLDALLDVGAGLDALIAERMRVDGTEPRADVVADLAPFARIAAKAVTAIDPMNPEPAVAAPSPDAAGSGRALTDQEIEGLHIVKAIAARHMDVKQIHARPAQAYVAILHGDNNRRQIARLHFSAMSTRYVGTFVGRDETRHPIEGVEGIYRHEPAIIARLREIEDGDRARMAEGPRATDGTQPAQETMFGQDGGDGESAE